MKILDKHNNYLRIFYLPILVIALIIVLFFSQQALISLRAHWLCLLFLVFLVFTPMGKIRLGTTTNISMSLLTRFNLLLIATLGISCLYAGFMFISLQGLPISITSNQNLAELSAKNII